MKKTPGDINILYIYILNNDHMMHDSWNVRHNRQFLSFRTIFCPFTTLTQLRKSKFWKTEKNTWTYYHSTHVPWMTITSYIIVPGTWSATKIGFYHFGKFFAFYLSNNQQPRRSKFWNEKNVRSYYLFTQVYHK